MTYTITRIPDFLFQAAKRAGWLPADDSGYPKATHVGFGLVLGEDGKRFRTRSTEVVRLVDLLDEAKSRSKTALIERGNVSFNAAELFVSSCTSLSLTKTKTKKKGKDSEHGTSLGFSLNNPSSPSQYVNIHLHLEQARLKSGLNRSLSKQLGLLVIVLLSKSSVL